MKVSVTGTDENGNCFSEVIDIPHPFDSGGEYGIYVDRQGIAHRAEKSGVWSIFYPPPSTSTGNATNSHPQPSLSIPFPTQYPSGQAPVIDPVIETYRRNTHDESGQPRSFRKEQEEAWKLTHPIGAMVPMDEWITLDEIEKRLDSYCEMTRTRKFFDNEVEETIALLVIHGLISKK